MSPFSQHLISRRREIECLVPIWTGLRTGLSGDFQAQVTERTIRHEIHSQRPPAHPPPPLPGPGRIKTADWMQQFGSFLLLK